MANRQLVLVNSARALKYLEEYSQRQAKLFTVLEKYHQILDGLEDLKTQFQFLKEATSRNIQNLQQATNLQQSSATALCGHVNVIYTRLVNLEDKIQKIQEKSIMDQDTVQIKAPDFGSDIDGPPIQDTNHNTAILSVHELLQPPEPKQTDASSPPPESTHRDRMQTSSLHRLGSHRSDNPTSSIPRNLYLETSPIPTPNRITETISTDGVPEIDKDLENEQFDNAESDLIDHHNTYTQSERICREYSEQLHSLTDNIYYSKIDQMVTTQYSTLYQNKEWHDMGRSSADNMCF